MMLSLNCRGGERGEIAGTLKKSRLIYNILDILKNVDAVSDTLTVDEALGSYVHIPVTRTKTSVASVRRQ
jgi:predicted Zn-dependent protease